MEGSGLDLRASDADRERVVDLLRDHTTAGRLTLEELDERIDRAYAARTLGDLVPLTSDLPSLSGGGAVGAPSASAARVGPSRSANRWLVSVMSGVDRRGRWAVPRETQAIAVMGACQLDLREADIEGPEVVITAVAVMGSVDVIVPEGMQVELEGIAVMGAKECRLADVPVRADLPRVTVRAFALMGGVGVKSKPPRGEGGRWRLGR